MRDAPQDALGRAVEEDGRRPQRVRVDLGALRHYRRPAVGALPLRRLLEERLRPRRRQRRRTQLDAVALLEGERVAEAEGRELGGRLPVLAEVEVGEAVQRAQV